MSNYLSIKICNIHEEDYMGFYEVCLKLKKAGLLDDAVILNSGGWEEESGIQAQVLAAFKKKDPNPKRYLDDK